MVKIEELRIGNLLYIAGKERAITEISYDEDGDDTVIFTPREPSFECCHISHASPIVITSKELKRFGFKETQNNRFEKDGFFCYIVLGEEGWKCWVNLIKDDFTIVLINFVHELQNFYYTLMNKEL